MKADEDLVATVLAELGYRCERFSKEEMRKGLKTPEFRVFDNGSLALFCEVKTFTDPTGFYDKLKATIGKIVSEMQKGSTKSNRLVNRIRDAIQKFKDVNPDHVVPNLAVIVNRDEMFLVDDVAELIQGHVQTTNGHVFHTIPKVSRDRFAPDRDVIDAYLVLTRINEPPETGNMLYFLEESLRKHPPLTDFLNRYKKWIGQPGV